MSLTLTNARDLSWAKTRTPPKDQAARGRPRDTADARVAFPPAEHERAFEHDKHDRRQILSLRGILGTRSP